MTRRITLMVSSVGVLFAASLGAPVAGADPSIFNNGFGNAQDTINALAAQGYNVIINGAAVYPLSGCKVTGVEGLRDSNVKPSGSRTDPTQFDTVYVDISCKGG
jgi:hypothetical protein